MTDQLHTTEQLLRLIPDNDNGQITAQDFRDIVTSYRRCCGQLKQGAITTHADLNQMETRQVAFSSPFLPYPTGVCNSGNNALVVPVAGLYLIGAGISLDVTVPSPLPASAEYHWFVRTNERPIPGLVVGGIMGVAKPELSIHQVQGICSVASLRKQAVVDVAVQIDPGSLITAPYTYRSRGWFLTLVRLG